MTDILLDNNTSIDVELTDEPYHYFCCTLPEGYAGVTTTLCDKPFPIFSLVQEEADGQDNDCGTCIQRWREDYCPLGHTCEGANNG